jgi:hypothetical protein
MMKKTRVFSAVLWASLLTPAALLASGCQIGCTQAGCLAGVTIDINGFESDQAYSLDIETPDETIKCTLPAGVDMNGTRSMQCDDLTIIFTEEYGALIDIEDNPDRVEITVRQGDTVVAEHDVEPTYRRSAPNGESCGPICHHADIPVQL